ncbi:hypothetical protein GCM10020256_52530 [Streptomyces thermocoprophilus]
MRRAFTVAPGRVVAALRVRVPSCQFQSVTWVACCQAPAARKRRAPVPAGGGGQDGGARADGDEGELTGRHAQLIARGSGSGGDGQGERFR